MDTEIVGNDKKLTRTYWPKKIKNFFKSWKKLIFTIYTFPNLRGRSWRFFQEEMTNN